MKRWPEIAVRNPLVTYLIFGLVMLFCAYSYTLMPQSEDPVLDLPTVGVGVVYPGASVADIENEIAEPIESAMSELSDVVEVRTSINEDACYVAIEFAYGVDPSEKIDYVQAKINNLRDELPVGIYGLDVYKYSTSNVKVLQYALVAPEATYKAMFQQAEQLEKEIKKSRLVSDVNILAYPESEIHVLIDPSRLQYYNISLDQIEQSLQSYNAIIPGGRMHVGTQVFKIKTSGRFENLSETA